MKKIKYVFCFLFFFFGFTSVYHAQITRTCKYNDSMGNDVVVSFDEKDKPTAYVRTYCENSENCDRENGQGNREDISNWSGIEAIYKNHRECFPYIVLNKEPLLISFKGYVVTAGFSERDIEGVVGHRLTLSSSTDSSSDTPDDDIWDREPPDYDTDYAVKDTDIHTICSMPSYRKPMKFVGILVRLSKILVPLAIIAYGAYDLYKAMTGSKDDEIKKAFKSIAIRIIAGVFIFLLPGLIQFVLNMVNDWSEYKNSWCCCTECLLNKDCNVNACDSASCHIEGTNK